MHLGGGEAVQALAPRQFSLARFRLGQRSTLGALWKSSCGQLLLDTGWSSLSYFLVLCGVVWLLCIGSKVVITFLAFWHLRT